jgi:hypothetical protein
MKDMIKSPEGLSSPEQQIEKIQITKEHFMNMVYENGKRIISPLDSKFIKQSYSYIEKDELNNNVAQATYEFNGALYLVEFDVKLGKEQGQMGYPSNLFSYDLTPKNIKTIELPEISDIQ